MTSIPSSPGRGLLRPATAGTGVASAAAGRNGFFASPAGLGITCMVASVFVFSVSNAIIKWLSGDFSPLEIQFFRGVFGLIPLVAVAMIQGRGSATRPPARSAHPSLQILRGVLAITSNACFVLAFRTMPLADAISIAYAAPIFVTVLSIPLLREKVGLHRWGAVVVGFVGVLVIARPGDGVLQEGALLAILGTLLYALMIITTRRLGGTDATWTTMLWSTCLYIAICGLAMPFLWATPTWPQIGLFLAIGCISGVGMFLFIQSYRLAPAAVVAPFDYTAMAWAVLIGFMIWGEVPPATTFIGIGIIAAAGLYIVHREQVRGRPTRTAPRPA